MTIEKGLYQAPVGLEEALNEEPALEIEIEDPESVEIGIDGMPILRIEPDAEDEDEFDENLAEKLSDGELAQLAEIGRAHV